MTYYLHYDIISEAEDFVRSLLFRHEDHFPENFNTLEDKGVKLF